MHAARAHLNQTHQQSAKVLTCMLMCIVCPACTCQMHSHLQPLATTAANETPLVPPIPPAALAGAAQPAQRGRARPRRGPG
jgi:hypothetical protein